MSIKNGQSNEVKGLGIESYSSNVYIEDSSFQNLMTMKGGSAIYAYDSSDTTFNSSLLIKNSTFKQNRAYDSGACIFV